MKIRTLFNLLDDAQEITSLFSKVETPEQMVSTLERLKKQGATEFLDAIQTLRLSVEATYEESLEMGGGLGFDGEEEEETREDENLLEGLGNEEENTDEQKPQEESTS